MTMIKRQLVAARHTMDAPVQWIAPSHHRAIPHEIEALDLADTPDGEMLLVKLRHNTELANPDVDVALLVGQARTYRRTGIVDPQSPELWFYDDQFWVKARSSYTGHEYYHNKCYLLYAVTIQDPDRLMAQLHS